MRTVLDVQEIRRRTGNQQQARVDMALWFGHVVARVSNCAPVDAEQVLVEIRLKGAQRDGPEAVRILRHLGGRVSLRLVDTALDANSDFHCISLWR